MPTEALYRHSLVCSMTVLPGPSNDYERNLSMQEAMGGAVKKACKDVNAAAPVVDDPAMEQCAVCLSPAKDVPRIRRARRCGHEFCAECVERWLGEHTTCPLCVCDLSCDGGHRFVTDSEDAIAGRPLILLVQTSSRPFRRPQSSAVSELLYHIGEMRDILNIP